MVFVSCFLEKRDDGGEDDVGIAVHRDADDVDGNLWAELADQQQIGREVEVMGGGAHRIGLDFVEADLAYGFEAEDGVEGGEILAVSGEVELIRIGETERMSRESRLETR